MKEGLSSTNSFTSKYHVHSATLLLIYPLKDYKNYTAGLRYSKGFELMYDIRFCKDLRS